MQRFLSKNKISKKQRKSFVFCIKIVSIKDKYTKKYDKMNIRKGNAIKSEKLSRA